MKKKNRSWLSYYIKLVIKFVVEKNADFTLK